MLKSLAQSMDVSGLLSITWHRDADASFVDSPKSCRALPAAPITARVSIDRQHTHVGLGQDAWAGSEQRGRDKQTRERDVPLCWFDTHGDSSFHGPCRWLVGEQLTVGGSFQSAQAAGRGTSSV